MIIEKRLLSELKPADYNPRKDLTPDDAEYQKIKNSILRFGYSDPMIINRDGTIVGGHQRYKVLKDLGYTEAECVVVDLSKDDEKAFNIALNKISGEWDEDALKSLLKELDLDDYDLSLTGFSTEELEDLIDIDDFEGSACDDDYDPDAAADLEFVKSGEVWQLGRHRLMCGDSTSAADIRKLMGQEELDLVITDPPYNVNYQEKAKALNRVRPNKNGDMEIDNDFMEDGDFYDFLLAAFNNINTAMRDGAAVYVFHADSEGLTFRQAFADAGLKLSEVLIWEKSHFVMGRQDYQWRHEPVLYGWKEGAGHYFINDRTNDTVLLEDDVDLEAMKKSELMEYIRDITQRYADQTTVMYEKKPVSSSMHPTMKPVELVGKFMKNSSKRGWNVGDFFAGSGTTLVAAEQLGRNAFCMECSPHYASVIVDRWENLTGRKAVKIED